MTNISENIDLLGAKKIEEAFNDNKKRNTYKEINDLKNDIKKHDEQIEEQGKYNEMIKWILGGILLTMLVSFFTYIYDGYVRFEELRDSKIKYEISIKDIEVKQSIWNTKIINLEKDFGILKNNFDDLEKSNNNIKLDIEKDIKIMILEKELKNIKK